MSAADPLVSVTSLARRLAGGEPPVLLDVRWRLGGPPGIEAYRAGHLPGAAYVDLDRDLAGPPGAGGRHPLPDPARFQAAMRRAGVRSGRPVVAYDDADATVAARLWWSLRYFGHDQVQVLDGGYRGWAEAGRPVLPGEQVLPGAADPAGDAVVPGEADQAGGDFTAVAGQMRVLDAAGAAAIARSGFLLDARAAERYRGETEPVDPVAGHIPGALSVPTTGNLTARGRFLPRGELARRFAALGITTGQDGAVGAYCGSGVTAAHEVLALELAGITAALYVGSWSGWVTDPGRPVATGADPG